MTVTPEFEKEFSALCEKHGVAAAFVILEKHEQNVTFYVGGHVATCLTLQTCVRHANTNAEKNVTKH